MIDDVFGLEDTRGPSGDLALQVLSSKYFIASTIDLDTIHGLLITFLNHLVAVVVQAMH